MSEIFDFDPVADNNTARWPENMLAATVNNSAREDEAILARDFRDRTPYAQTSGSSTAYTLTAARSITSLAATTTIWCRIHTTCGAAPTFNLNGLGAYPIRKGLSGALQSGELPAGIVAGFAFDVVNNAWQLLTPVATTLNNQAFGLSIGDVKLSLRPTPEAGFIRLKETAQAITQTAYPDLYAWLSSMGFPWGGSAGTANVPPAGGYYLRFGASNATVDTGGTRATAGVVQGEQFKTTAIPSSGLTASASVSLTNNTNVIRTTALTGTATGSFGTAGGSASSGSGSTTLDTLTPSATTTLGGSATLSSEIGRAHV